MADDHYVYRAFDRDGECLYVGLTNRIEQRLRTHREHSHWASSNTQWHVTGPISDIAAHNLEMQEIWCLDPKHNKVVASTQSALLASLPVGGPPSKFWTSQLLANLLEVHVSDARKVLINHSNALPVHNNESSFYISDAEVDRLRLLYTRAFPKHY